MSIRTYRLVLSFIRWIYPPLTVILVELINAHSEAFPSMVGAVEVNLLPYAPGKTDIHVMRVIAMKNRTFF
jgi:hypothetical protein